MQTEAIFCGIKAGDWLQALATVIAVVGTILGTLHIERKKRDASAQEDINRILEVVEAIQKAASEIRNGLPEDATNFDHYARSLNMQTALKTALDMYQFVRADTKVKNLNMWRALRSLDEVIVNHGQTIVSELHTFIANGNYTKVFEINRAKVMAASVPIDVAAQAVIAAG